MKRRPIAASGGTATIDGMVPSYQPLGIEGYHPYPVVADWQQVGLYNLPLASVSMKNAGGFRRRDGVESLSPRTNQYMPNWQAPNRGRTVTNVGGRAESPMNSFQAAQVTVNAFSANADQASLAADFMATRSPRYSGASYSAMEA